MATWLKQVRGVRRVPTNRGDTLRTIALRELGDASLWTQIVGLNNLLPPYLVDDISQVTSSRVLLAGALISIPAPEPPPSGTADDPDPLATDFLLQGGMLTDDGAGDIATVSSYANLKQALEHRLATRPGELLPHPRYGCRVYELLGQGNGPVALQLAAAYVGRCVRSDARVTDASSLVAAASGDSIVIGGNAIPADGTVLPVGTTIGA